MNDVWIRLHTGWAPNDGHQAVAWALWQLSYSPEPWPPELRPNFAYYVCEHLKAGGRGIVARATVTDVLRTSQAASPDEAYRMVADRLFDDELTIPIEDWRARGYNKIKADAPWPQLVTAWRITTEQVGPHVLPELARFPRSGWLRSSSIAL